MQQFAFKMRLIPGKAEEYKSRHDKIWPELAVLLKKTGICDYHIFLDEETSTLFATYKINNVNTIDSLPHYPLMQEWWKYMADVVESHADNSPINIPLTEMFYLH